MISQQGMEYCCVYHSQILFPGFLLLIEPFSLCSRRYQLHKEYLTIMSSLTQDDGHQSSDVLLSVWECNKFDRRGKKGNKECWHYAFCRNKYNIWNYTTALIHLTISGGHIMVRVRFEILPKYQRQFKALQEKKEVSRNQRVSNRDILQTLVHSDAEAISTYLLSRKRERYLVPLLLNQIGLSTQLRKTLRGKVMNNLIFQVIF